MAVFSRQKYLRDRDAIIARVKRYHHANREKMAARRHERQITNASEISARKRAYYLQHAEDVKRKAREYRAAHPEHESLYSRNRKARALKAGGTHSADDIRAQYERQRGKCYWGKAVNPECAVSLKNGYHVDHVIPLAGERESSNGIENLVLACPACNCSKQAKDPMEWAGVMF
jgi:5-methylcytosine-specific restriction endonuclease McrA